MPRTILLVVSLMGFASRLLAGDAVALRAEQFTVPPATGPVTHAVIQNLNDTPWKGRVSLSGPEGWRMEPPEREVTLVAKETQRVAFTVAKAVNLDANRYPMEIVAVGDDGSRTTPSP